MLFPLLLVSAAFARTECPASAAQVHGKLTAALAAYEELDTATYERLRAEVNEEVACLTEVVPPALARDLHLLHAMERYFDRDNAGVLLTLRGMLAADPGYRLSTGMFVEGHEFRGLLSRAREPGKGDPSSMLAPREGDLLLDGDVATERPAGRAVLLQWAAPSGQVCWSGYLDPVQSLPPSLVAAATAEGGLLACLVDRKAYEHPSVAPLAARPRVVATSAPAEEAAEGDVFGDMARLLEGGAEPTASMAPEEPPGAEVPAPGEPAHARRLGPLLRLGGVVVAAGDPEEVSWAADGIQPAGYRTAGIEALIGLELRFGERFGLRGGLGGLTARGASADLPVKSRVTAAEARLQAALHLGRLGLLAGPTWRLGATGGSDWVEQSAAMVAWDGQVRSLGLALDLGVDLGVHLFAGAGGSLAIDGARTWSTISLGLGWKL
ncbi:MAG: hypothetical protein ABIO70_12710 [Pseudomonadota bacterium]